MQTVPRRPMTPFRPLIAALFLYCIVPCYGVIVYSDPGRLTAAPTGKLVDSGWQYEGQWAGAYTGTPIAPDYFITASHIGGSVGGTFTLNGVDYTTTAEYTDPDSDLRIWKVDGTFSSYATLDTKKNEVGKQTIIFGRGTDRGDAITSKKKTIGWEWGSSDDSLSWGTNTIAAAPKISGDNLLEIKFKGNKSHPDEAAISEGDSGGGVFVKIGKTWELAGINFSAPGPYSIDPDFSDSFNASLLNSKGLYTFNSSDQPILLTSSQPSIDYATRISTESKWIDSVLAGDVTSQDTLANFTNIVPEPATIFLPMVVLAIIFPRRCRRYTDRSHGELHRI
jgi:hypothetical protein